MDTYKSLVQAYTSSDPYKNSRMKALLKLINKAQCCGSQCEVFFKFYKCMKCEFMLEFDTFTTECITTLDSAQSKTLSEYELNEVQNLFVQEALRGRDTLLLAPTGFGKSICYILPALVDFGVTVVISPLLSLIRDQMTSLSEMGIESYHWTDTPGFILHRHKIIFTTPEKLCMDTHLLEFLYANHFIARFVIDECHCITQWGYDFRPLYMKFSEILHKTCPTVPLMALTGSATRWIRSEITSLLHMKGNLYMRSVSLNRPNLVYFCIPKVPEYKKEIIRYISSHKNKSGIIYCLTRKDCETFSARIARETDISVDFYHSTRENKEQVHDAWMKGQTKLLVATIAFGMGINKKDVRYVIHNDLPLSICHYYQETGRAGRDGAKAECLVFFNKADTYRIDQMIQPKFRHYHRTEINKMYQYCVNNYTCRRVLLMDYFGDTFNDIECEQFCDNCKKRDLEEVDVTDEAVTIINFVQCSKEKYSLHRLLSQLSLFITEKNYQEIYEIVRTLITEKYLRETYTRVSVGNRTWKPDSQFTVRLWRRQKKRKL